MTHPDTSQADPWLALVFLIVAFGACFQAYRHARDKRRKP